MNPKGAVTVLVTDDGSVLTESLAILLFIAQSAPESRLGAPAADALATARLNYGRLDRQMQGKSWRVFDRRTVPDAYLYVMCTWKDQTPTPLAAFPALAAFRTRLDRDPDIQQVISDEESGLQGLARRA